MPVVKRYQHCVSLPLKLVNPGCHKTKNSCWSDRVEMWHDERHSINATRTTHTHIQDANRTKIYIYLRIRSRTNSFRNQPPLKQINPKHRISLHPNAWITQGRTENQLKKYINVYMYCDFNYSRWDSLEETKTFSTNINSLENKCHSFISFEQFWVVFLLLDFWSLCFWYWPI